jgi:hypothetical protein
MPMTQSECERAIKGMSPEMEIRFLSILGNWLTVVARDTYEFQAPGVNDPITLRAFNELHHRLYAQLRGLTNKGKGDFDAKDITSWLTGENQSPKFQSSCLWAFEQALTQLHNSSA